MAVFSCINAIFRKLQQSFFVWWYMIAIRRYYEDMDATRSDLFEELRDFESLDEDLRKKGQIRILEIGVGPGANFKHYPKNANLIAVDTNPYFRKHFDENFSKFPDIVLEQFVLGEGENMRVVKEGSVDVVVTTGVLCSVKDVAQVLKEINRVLAPGGKYFFMEHVSAEQGTYQRLFQTLLNPLWGFLSEGCHLTRTSGQMIKQAGFSNIKMRHFSAPFNSILNLVLSPHVMGTAEKWTEHRAN